MTETPKFEAPRKAMAVLLALTIALGPTAMPAFAAAKPAASALQDGDADQASGRDF